MRRWLTAPVWILLGLIALGVALRLVAAIAWWPVSPTLEDGYQRFASNPFLDLQHSAGYDLIVAGLGHISRQVAFTVLVQHLAGLTTAVLYWAAARRLTGSRWPGLLPAAIVLLDPDQIFLEHAIMSETWLILAIAIALYAAVRAIEDPVPWWRWPVLSGVAMAGAIMIRSAAAPMFVVIALGVLLARPGAGRHWSAQLRAALTLSATVVLLLLAFAGAGAAFGNRFAITPSPGWYLYGRVAQFADCRDFTPPPGTRSLCQTIAANQRPSAYDYMFTPSSPAVRRFGGFGRSDSIVGGWARRALVAQPLAFLSTAWGYLRAYWVPSALPTRLAGSTGLDPQLDFTFTNPFAVAAIHADLERFYVPFTVHPHHWGLQVLHDVSRVIRFGGLLLSITTVLVLAGLFVGPRRLRVGVLMFGVGGLSLILIPALLSTYSGRYTVPMAAPMMTAAALALSALWSLRRAPPPGPA